MHAHRVLTFTHHGYTGVHCVRHTAVAALCRTACCVVRHHRYNHSGASKVPGGPTISRVSEVKGPPARAVEIAASIPGTPKQWSPCMCVTSTRRMAPGSMPAAWTWIKTKKGCDSDTPAA